MRQTNQKRSFFVRRILRLWLNTTVPTDYHACTASKQQQTNQPGLQALSPAQFLKEAVLPRQISLNVNVYYLYLIILLASVTTSSNQV